MSKPENVLVYRTGTITGPEPYVRDKSEVWLITDPRLYYPLHQEKDEKGSVDVYLWRAVIDPSKLRIQLEDHPQFKGVCLVKTENPHNSLQLHKDLESLPWEKAEVSKCRGGMSLLDCNSLVQAIVEYMKDNYPTTPEEFNFQAELKVVSHWHWFEGKESPRRKPGPRDDFRVKRAVKKTFQKWCRDVRDQESANQSSESDDEYISGLKEDICALKMYFNKGELEEDETENEKYSHVQYENEDESWCSLMELKLTENCDDGNSDFDNQSISRMKSNRSADENVVPDVQTKPNREKKSPEAESSARGTSSVEQATNSGEKGTKPEKKKVEVKDELSKLLDFKKLDISELDCIFTDFKTTLDPFVQNREDMAKAEESFKKAVTTLEQINPHAQFSEYVHALKWRLTSEGIAVKIKEGALAIYTEGKKTV